MPKLKVWLIYAKLNFYVIYVKLNIWLIYCKMNICLIYTKTESLADLCKNGIFDFNMPRQKISVIYAKLKV